MLFGYCEGIYAVIFIYERLGFFLEMMIKDVLPFVTVDSSFSAPDYFSRATTEYGAIYPPE